MTKRKNPFSRNLTLLGVTCANLIFVPVHAETKDLSEKAAQIYCFMRNNENLHEVSWDAAYESIKRKSEKFFKTSPKHAAVMIVEKVVQDPNSYENCGRYLGDLFGGSKEEALNTSAKSAQSQNRYSY